MPDATPDRLSKRSLSRKRGRWQRLKRPVFSLLLLALVVAGGLALKAGVIRTGAEAYLYGYPLVMVDLTREAAARTIGPENELRRVRQFPDASFRGVVRPNVDTLYTTAFIDMAAGPFVFEMAPNDQRYALMPFMDAWTNVFASPGSRTTGQAGGRFVLAGPGWAGSVPEGMSLLRSPTRIVWLIGRIQTDGAADYPLVRRLQDGITLRPLSASVDATTAGAAAPAGTAWRPEVTAPPILQMAALSADAFFTRLARLLTDNPAAAADAPMVARLARLGVAPGQPPQWGRLDQWAVGLGRWLADWSVARALEKPRNPVRGWSTPPANLGQFGADYRTRAAVAKVGLGANLPADATYPSTRIDAQGRPLDGSQRYRLHFKAGELPPVKAFWSVTAYGEDDFLIGNPINRYALGDRDPLVRNADGSLDLLVQATPPDGAMQANWLPVKAGEPFLLTARLYWPKAEVLSGSWGMPAVERTN